MTLETSFGRAARWTIGAAIVGSLFALLPQPSDLLTASLLHLCALVAFSFVLTIRLERATDMEEGTTLNRFARAASVVALIAGATVIATLVSASAYGFEVSLQFLQLLSALDIAWVVAAFYFGLRWLRGPSLALPGGVAMAVFCVWSIWRYLDAVGFTAEGGWLVDAEALQRLVFPLDAAAAVVAIVTLLAGARQATAQRSPQS